MRSIAGYVRRHHIGLLALFVALGGTAYAVQKAPKDSVVSKSIKDGQVKPKDAKFTKTFEFPGTVTLSEDFEELEPFKVTVPKSGLVSIYAEGEISKTAGAPGSPCNISLSTTAAIPYTPILTVSSDSNGFDLKRTAPATEGIGVYLSREAAPITYSLEPGKYDFGLAYNAFTNTNCQFRDAKVVIIPLP